MTAGPADEADDARRGRAVGGALPAAEGAAGVSGAAVEDLARALHLKFDDLGSMKAYERAYSAYRREGNLLAAARAARTLGWFHGSVYGEWARIHRERRGRDGRAPRIRLHRAWLPPELGVGAAAMKGTTAHMHAGLHDCHCEIEDLIAKGPGGSPLYGCGPRGAREHVARLTA